MCYMRTYLYTQVDINRLKGPCRSRTYCSRSGPTSSWQMPAKDKRACDILRTFSSTLK